jgi:hypothetical protein
VFIDPQVPVTPPAITPSTANLAVSPFPTLATAPLLIGGTSQQTPPLPPDTDPTTVTPSFGPLVAVGGDTLAIAGNGLDSAAAAQLFLKPAGSATEWDVTAWRQGVSPGELDLLLPSAYADPSVTPPPSAMPFPGPYTIAVGAGANRSNAIPLVVAPRIDGVVDPPLLAPAASGVYTIDGGGFAPASGTSLAFGATPLTATAGVPAAGQFAVNAAGTEITFLPPTAAQPGSYPVLLTVGGIAASTGWVVVLA